MSEFNLISPLLDSFAMGDSVSEHDGVCCCPAMDENTKEKYIVKIISIPATQAKLDALLLTGAYPSVEAASAYFKELADDIISEVQMLDKLSQMEGFVPYKGAQIVPMADATGFLVYLLSPYKRSLRKSFSREPMTHLRAINLGLDLCAALSVCRRYGYLYVNLKPENVFITENNEYKIGDLGFIRMSSLKYASLPERYHSQYTAPEISDAFSSLNDTIDIYSLGLILYQAYNGGELPFSGDTAPEEQLPPPAYADYEMAEIILKACSPNPQDRWQDPTEMGQALVSYMQRNGANDTPIVTVSPIAEDPQPVETIAEVSEADESSDSGCIAEETLPEIIDGTEAEHAEDELDALRYLADSIQEDLDVSYQEVTDEVSTMLTMADDLVEHPVPTVDITTEPIEIPIPKPIVLPEDPDSKEDVNIDTSETVIVELSEEDTDSAEETEPSDATSEEQPDETDETGEENPPAKNPRPTKVIIRSLIAVLLVFILAAGAYLFYHYYYIQKIDDIALQGNNDQLTVYLQGTADETALIVSCSDDYGNKLTAEVIGGKAEFTGLLPNTRYTIRVGVEGFHGITGVTTASYNTPAQTNIQEFTAITGSEDGSVILKYTLSSSSSSDSDSWQVHYDTDGEETKAVSFTGDSVTITGLTVGKTYTFKLIPENETYVVGIDTITYTAQKLIYAQNLKIVSVANNSLTATWESPEDASIDSWKVHCFNSDGTYNETMVVTDTTVTFENLDHTDGYTVEVLADGMTVSQRASIGENSITITDLSVDTSKPSIIVLTWQSSASVPPEGWTVTYRIHGVEAEQTATCKENVLVISDAVPGSTYSFHITAPANPVICEEAVCETPEATTFSCNYDNFPITAEDMVFRMCKTPSINNWTRYDLKSSDYTTEFARGEKASFSVRLTKVYGFSSDPITILFVVKDENGTILSIDSTETAWNSLWDMYYGTIDVPSIPAVAGTYQLTIYFNAAFVMEQSFTVS